MSEGELVKIGVAWTKQGNKGKYMSVQLDLSGIEIPPDGLIHAFLFPNEKRTKDTHPNAQLMAKAVAKVNSSIPPGWSFFKASTLASQPMRAGLAGSENQDSEPGAEDPDVPF